MNPYIPTKKRMEVRVRISFMLTPGIIVILLLASAGFKNSVSKMSF
jgi:hypothetical protein